MSGDHAADGTRCCPDNRYWSRGVLVTTRVHVVQPNIYAPSITPTQQAADLASQRFLLRSRSTEQFPRAFPGRSPRGFASLNKAKTCRNLVICAISASSSGGDGGPPVFICLLFRYAHQERVSVFFCGIIARPNSSNTSPVTVISFALWRNSALRRRHRHTGLLPSTRFPPVLLLLSVSRLFF